MKVIVCVLCLLAPQAFVQAKPGSALPPPAMDAPGSRPVTASSVPAPTLVVPELSAGSRAKEVEPEVKVYQREENTVQEFSRGGQVYMIVVTPPNGPAETYFVDPNGRVVDEHGQKPIKPVMFKVFEWGKSKPVESNSTP